MHGSAVSENFSVQWQLCNLHLENNRNNQKFNAAIMSFMSKVLMKNIPMTTGQNVKGCLKRPDLE